MSNPKRALAVAAHPDDIEFLMSGTLLRLAEVGYEIHYWNLADGCCGTNQYTAEEIRRIRREEAIAAAHSIGAKYHESICRDIEIFYNKSNISKVTSVVRQVQPEIVLTHSPVDYMEDHTMTCRLVVTGAFCRGMPNFSSDPACAVTDQPTTIYHAQPYSHHDPLGQLVKPSICIDVTSQIEKKVAMLSLHQSQKRWLDESQGLDAYLNTLRELDALAGKMSGQFQYAEGWRRHLHLGLCGPKDCPLSNALSAHVARLDS